MITNFEIEDICHKENLPLIGVFSKDELPKDRRMGGSYYINLQNSDAGCGTHWVFCRIFHNATALYFDSFGISLMPQEIAEFLSIFKPVATNNRQIQDIHSEMCGRFCIALDFFLENETRSKNNIDR